MRRTFVVFVNYNSTRLLEACLRSLGHRPNVATVIWDNASSASELERLRLVVEQNPSSRLIVSETNVGFGPAVNRAIDASGAGPDDCVWILNPDTVVSDDALDLLELRITQNPGAVLSPVILSSRDHESQNVWFQGGGLDVKRGRSAHVGIGREYAPPPEQSVPTSFITGAAPFMSWETWKVLGGFREDLFLYWEDVDFSIRAQALGVPLLVVHGAPILHFEDGSSAAATGRSEVFYYYASRNRLLVCRGSGRARLELLLVSGLKETVKSVLIILVRERGHRLRKLAAFLAGCVAGVRGETGPGRGPAG